ncbi:hypothetical protein NT6N_23900 [Oceaniferula spumae]|uniref:DUF4158 domain-containing protein n=1 Tax=Oceaniferula spumae TaxID=2979115 RepID=A0AAT9FMY6_9BACT
MGAQKFGLTSRCIRPLTVLHFLQFYSNQPFEVCDDHTPAVELYVRQEKKYNYFAPIVVQTEIL